jgi:hypothetical protein
MIIQQRISIENKRKSFQQNKERSFYNVVSKLITFFLFKSSWPGPTLVARVDTKVGACTVTGGRLGVLGMIIRDNLVSFENKVMMSNIM